MEKKEQRWKAAVVTLSDKGYAGEREDKSGPLLCSMLEEAGYEVTEVRLLPDEQKMIEQRKAQMGDYADWYPLPEFIASQCSNSVSANLQMRKKWI